MTFGFTRASLGVFSTNGAELLRPTVRQVFVAEQTNFSVAQDIDGFVFAPSAAKPIEGRRAVVFVGRPAYVRLPPPSDFGATSRRGKGGIAGHSWLMVRKARVHYGKSRGGGAWLKPVFLVLSDHSPLTVRVGSIPILRGLANRQSSLEPKNAIFKLQHPFIALELLALAEVFE
jgi:hypothetical protein